MMPSPAEVARRLGGDVSGRNQILAPGPNHSPQDRSMSIKLDARAPDGFLVNSFANDDPLACKDYVRERMGMPSADHIGTSQPIQLNQSRLGRLVAEYDYTDEMGDTLFQVVRYEPKTFRQRRPDGNGGWISSIKEARRVPYKLPELIEAIANDRPIFVVEGEKAVDALSKLGVTATCSPGGGGHWRGEYSAYLKDANVVILPDNDEPGAKHAEDVSRALRDIADSVRILRLPNLPPKGDPYDWIAAGGTDEKLWELVETPEPEPDLGFTLTTLEGIAPEKVQWFYEPYLPKGALTLAGGMPGEGKSTVLYDFISRISTGKHFPNGPKAPHGKAILLSSEDDPAKVIVPRLSAMKANLSNIALLENKITRDGKGDRFNLQNDLAMLERAIDRLGNVQLVVVDALNSYMGDVESFKDTEVRKVLDPLNELAAKMGVCIVGIMHPPKSRQSHVKNAFSGSVAYVAAARSALFFSPEPDSIDGRKLMLHAKTNYGPLGRGCGYRIVGTTVDGPHGEITTSKIEWDDAPVDFSADQLYNTDDRRDGCVQEAEEWLKDQLANGPVPSKEIDAAAKAEMVSNATLRRAKKKLKIKSRSKMVDGKKHWDWVLP